MRAVPTATLEFMIDGFVCPVVHDRRADGCAGRVDLLDSVKVHGQGPRTQWTF